MKKESFRVCLVGGVVGRDLMEIRKKKLVAFLVF